MQKPALTYLTLLFLSIVNIVVITNRPQVKILSAKRDIVSEISFWDSVATKNPTYQEAFLKLADLVHTAGDDNQAEIYIQKAELIDPNSEDLKNAKLSLGF